MLSSNDPKYPKFVKRIKHFFQTNAKPNVEYVVGFETMPLELLRRAFSIPCENFKKTDQIENNKVQFQTIKLITQINEELMKYKIDKKDERDLAILLYTNSASSFDIPHYDKKNEFICVCTDIFGCRSIRAGS